MLHMSQGNWHQKFAGSEIEFSYPEEFMTILSRKIENTFNAHYGYSEVVSLRTKKILSDIKEGEYGGKIMPDYIAVYIKDWDKNASKDLTLAKKYASELGVKNIMMIDVDEYMKRDNILKRAKKGLKEHEPRVQTQFMKKIKTIKDGENGER